jgi:hypothetical protein
VSYTKWSDVQAAVVGFFIFHLLQIRICQATVRRLTFQTYDRHFYISKRPNSPTSKELQTFTQLLPTLNESRNT